jgi:hypothetical protein
MVNVTNPPDDFTVLDQDEPGKGIQSNGPRR